mmetsp:Transcript_26768/g.69284  ORF Transcript_26768/g.69284 Transcript_26768/m.69284 type:complete len:256 (+) Transcript_26768:33-800(+)
MVESELEIYVAGRTFSTKDAVMHELQEISALAGGEMLNTKDTLFVYSVLSHHPKAQEKICKAVAGITFKTSKQFPDTKCFHLVFDDGTEDTISVAKALEGLIAASKAGKRSRDVVDNKPGCVVLFSLPNRISTAEVRQALMRFGVVRYIEADPKRGSIALAAQVEAEDATDSDSQVMAQFMHAEPAERAVAECTEVAGVAVEVKLATVEQEKKFYAAKEAQEHASKYSRKNFGKGKGKGKSKGKGEGGFLPCQSS